LKSSELTLGQQV